MAQKIDFKKELKQLYSPSTRKFELIEVPELAYLMIDGQGDPNTSQAYQEALETLYTVAYTVKFISKLELKKDFVVMPLEGLWWADDPSFFTDAKKDAWYWTAMILQPAWIDQTLLKQAIEQAKDKKPLPALEGLRLERYHEGLSVQIMHIGPYADEGPTLKRLHEEFLPENSLQEAGKHHEIYLSDPRRTAPERLKTVLRQPVREIDLS